MKNTTKRLLAVALALVLCLSLLPGIALAADSYKKVIGLSDVTAGGNFVLVANGYAMDTTLQGNNKFNGIAVTPSGDTLSGSLPVWTFEAVEGGIAIKTGGQYLAYASSTNFAMQADPYTWSVEAGGNGFIIKSVASNKRGIFMQTSSSRFGAYSTTNTSGYVFELELYKEPSAGACEHDYVAEMTTPLTCTQDGVETNTCSKCGDTFEKTIASTGHNYVVGKCTKCGGEIATDPAKIISEAYALEEYESLPYDSILTGKVVSVDEEYSSSYNNITVTIAAEGYEEYPIQCYRLKGTGIDTLAVGDEISVFGSIKNYKGTIEFDSGCTVVTLAPADPAQIVADAYALAEGESLAYEAVLTGKITSVDEAYSEQYKNITVTMAVEGCEDKPIVCFRLKGEGVEALEVGDTITVAGTIKNYYGKIEFNMPTLIPNDTSATYIVAGVGELCGNAWAPDDVNNVMTDENGDGIYTKVYTAVAAGTYQFKVTDGSWDNSWGDAATGGNYEFTLTDACDVTVNFNTADNSITVEAEYLYQFVPGQQEYCLVGYINGADYGCEGDWENIGEYIFVDGTLTATFTVDSYIFVKTTDNANWYLTLAYTEDTSATFVKNASEKMKVPGGVALTFTLVENEDGTITVSYEEAPIAPVGVTVSGAVVTGAEGETLVELYDGETQITAAAVNGKEGTYTLENVAAGTYTLKVSKANHVTREYTVTVGEEDLAQDVKIHLIGDIDGNGKVNVGDVSKLNSHLKGTNVITDEYMLLCANVNGGKLNMGDTATLYSHIKGTKPLY